MALYEVYATSGDLAEYLFMEEEDLPSNHERLLVRASELIKNAVRDNINIYNENHLRAAKLATCAQVELWMEDGEGAAISGQVKSYAVSDVSVTNYDEKKGQLATRAKSYLSFEGLLYRGI